MEILYGILAGLAATFVMTLFLDIASAITGFNFHVPRILGTIARMDTRPSGQASTWPGTRLAGVAIHYAIGVVFALLYQPLIRLCRADSSSFNALLFGAAIGLVAMLFWTMMLKLHPKAPLVKLAPFLVFLFIAHLIFGLSMYGVYYVLNSFFA